MHPTRRGFSPLSLISMNMFSWNSAYTIFFISVHLSQGMRINYVHVHYANFALIIVMNLTNFNNILTSRLLNSLCISNILRIFLKLFGIYSFRSRENALHLYIIKFISYDPSVTQITCSFRSVYSLISTRYNRYISIPASEFTQCYTLSCV